MDRETLYLDNDEEITSVVDKLKGTEHVALDLIIPKEALLLQSVVNLKLLKRQADSLGKEITIVTQDKVGQKLAQQIGIPVIEKVGQQPKEVKMSEVDEGHFFTEDDIELKEREKSEEKPSKKEVTDATILPTEEVVEEATTKETINEIPEEEVSVELPKDKKAEKANKWKKIKKYGLIGSFVALGLFALAYIYVPLAHVTLKIAAERQAVDISFKADKSYKEVDTTAQVMPARIIEEEKETKNTYQATGKKKVGEKAKGSVTIFNNYSTTPQTLMAGDRLVSSSGLIFVVGSNITVAGYTDTGGNKTPGKVEGVIVTANDIGENYNVNANTTFSVPKVGNSLFYAMSTSSFAGGSSRDITFVTQADINSAKEEIASSAKTEIQGAIAQEIEDGETLVENALELKELSVTPSVAVNGEASEFQITAKYSAKAITIKDEDLKKLAEKVLADQIGSQKEIVEGESLVSSTEFIDADFEKGIMNARISGEAFIATKIDQDKLKTELSAEKDSRALEIINELGGVEEATVKYFPSFYKRVPRIKSHIYIKTEILKSDSTSEEEVTEEKAETTTEE